jgi:hypothetical protein
MKSVTMIQNELAVQRAKTGGLQRVVWAPEGTSSGQADHQAFIDALHSDTEVQFGADLITGDIETLKAAVHGALRKISDRRAVSEPAPAASDASAKLVYLICVERDRKATIPLRKFLQSEGLEVRIPLFSGDAATVRRNHEDLLSSCDCVLVFYGAGDEAWKRSIESDLRKMKGYRRDRPAPVTCTYLAEPATADKEELIELREAAVFDGLRGFAAAELEELLEAVRSGKG